MFTRDMDRLTATAPCADHSADGLANYTEFLAILMRMVLTAPGPGSS